MIARAGVTSNPPPEDAVTSEDIPDYAPEFPEWSGEPWPSDRCGHFRDTPGARGCGRCVPWPDADAPPARSARAIYLGTVRGLLRKTDGTLDPVELDVKRLGAVVLLGPVVLPPRDAHQLYRLLDLALTMGDDA